MIAAGAAGMSVLVRRGGELPRQGFGAKTQPVNWPLWPQATPVVSGFSKQTNYYQRRREMKSRKEPGSHVQEIFFA
jgi:hypothetical protein